MPTFSYRGKGSDGENRSGTILAENKRSALAALEQMKVFPTAVSERSVAEDAIRFDRLFDRVKPDEITEFLRQTGDLLAVGVPFDRAMEVLVRESTRPAATRLLAEIRSAVGSGASLSEALAAHPQHFPTLYVSMVEAGEEGGFLSSCLHRIASMREKQAELRSKVRSALVYPCVLAVFGTATVAYLVIFFVPRFTSIFQDMGGSLPAITRFLISASEVAGALWPYALGVLGVGAVFLGRWTSTPAGARVRDSFFLKVPYLRQVTIESALVRFTRTLGTLLESGVSILKSLEISAGAAGNLIFRDQIVSAADRVREGAGVAEGLRPAGEFPGLIKEKIAVGEETGRLPEVLLSISEQYEVSLERAVKLFVSVFEPLLIVLMAGIVGFIVISMLLPIFELNSMIQ